MAENSVRESGYSTDTDETERQFLADLEKAKALSMETAALEKFRKMTPPSAIPNLEDPFRQRRVTCSNSYSSVDKVNLSSTLSATKTEVNVRPRPGSTGKKYTSNRPTTTIPEPPSANNLPNNMPGNRKGSPAFGSDLISWEQSKEIKKEDELEKLIEMKSTVNQLYQQHSQIIASNNNGPSSLPYYSQPVNASTIQLPSQTPQRHSISSRTIHPTSSLPIPNSPSSFGRHSFDNHSMQTLGNSLLPPKTLSMNSESKSTTVSSAVTTYYPSTVSHPLTATMPVASTNEFSSMYKPPELPKRTIFLPNSTGTLGSPPNYGPNIAEMMQAVKKQQHIEPQKSSKMTNSFSLHDFERKSTALSPQHSAEMSQNRQDIKDKYAACASNTISPTHSFTGNLCSANSSELTSSSSGMVKSLSWTGNINRTRLPVDNGYPPRKGTNSPHLGSQSITPSYSVIDEARSKSAKSSPDHIPQKAAGLSGSGKDDNSFKRGHKSNSDYSIVKISSKYNPTCTKLPNIKERHPNDPLIDLNNDSGSKIKEPPLTKVSILEAFDPLIDGNTENDSLTPVQDNIVTSVKNVEEKSKTCQKFEAFKENIEDGEPIYYASSVVSDSSFYETYDPFEYMALSKSVSSFGEKIEDCDVIIKDVASKNNTNELANSSFSSTFHHSRTPSKKHMRHPSVDSGAADAKTIERRKKKKAEYENVIRLQKSTSVDLETYKPGFAVSSTYQGKEIAASYNDPDSLLNIIKEEKNIAADKETIAFTEMIRDLRLKWKSTDVNSNTGMIFSTRMETTYPAGETMKLVVLLPEGFHQRKIAFTYNVTSTIEHIITNVIVEMLVDSQRDEKRLSFDGVQFQYLLRVKDSCEYLMNDSQLKDYEYVHSCYKLDKDLEFVLEPLEKISRPFKRSIEDDISDSNIDVKDINTLDHWKKLSYNELKVLLELLEKESDRMGKVCSHLATTTDKNVIPQLRPQKVLQSIKAICAHLGGIETIEIRDCCDKLTIQCLEFDKAKGNEEPSGKLRPEIVNELGEHYATVILKKGTSTILQEHAIAIQSTLNELKETVQKLVEMYTKTFRVNFSFEKPGLSEQSCSKETIDIFETLVARVCILHRLNPDWPNFEDFAVRMQIFHGTRPIAEPPLTPFVSKSESFYENVVFDSWLESQTLRICGLPREARLVFTLIGRQQKKVENDGGSGRKSGEFVNVLEELGSASLQIFNYELLLAQGTFLLPLWPPGEEKVGPAPDSGSHPYLDTCPFLSVELPEIESIVTFPEHVPTQQPTTDVAGISYEFEDLDYYTKQQLLDICSQDIITFTQLPVHEKEVLWEKRYYLKNTPGALPKVLLAAHSWDYACLPGLYGLLEYYTKPEAMDILQLFLPCFPDVHVRQIAINWLSETVLDDDLVDFLPQLLEALKHETWATSPLAKLLLSRSLMSPRLAHSLYWLLTQSLPGSSPQNTTIDPTEIVSSVKVARYRRRLQMMMRALETICGQALRNAFLKQQVLLQHLNSAADEVKTVKDSSRATVLFHHMERLNNHLVETETPIPLSLAITTCGVDVKNSSYFSSNTFPLKIAFLSNPGNTTENAPFNEKISQNNICYAIYKVGDDLRQDQLTLQMIRVMDKLWLKDGLDMKMITFKCVPTGDKQGLVEMVTEAKTLKEIQVSGGRGVTGSFKDTPVADWLKKYNSSTLEFEKAKDNFTRSCAGYSIATYLLGICDRHNDNIMVKQSGHIFHIDYGKFLGDHQMVGNFKRDRTPFVLTPDMAYVINGCEKKPSEKFHEFVDLCCKGFNVVRKNGNLLLNLFALMASSGIPGVNHDAVKYVQSALLPDLSNSEAAATFARMIEESLSSWFTQWNFFFHNLAQMRFSGANDDFRDEHGGSTEGKSGGILSYVPRTYTMAEEGRIIEVQVYGIQKRYNPEKHYVFILKIQRSSSKVPDYIFRTYKEFCELDSKLCNAHPQARNHSLPKGIQFGRQEISEVAERRKHDVKTFLGGLFSLQEQVAHSDLVYTFFHPILRDQEEANIRQRKLKEEKGNARKTSVGKIQGELKLSIEYRKDALLVMVHHAKDLAMPDGSKEAPNSYVKVYLHPDPSKTTKRKTKVVRRNCHPTFMEMLEYRIPLDVVRCRTLQATLWDCDRFQENMFLGAVTIPLESYFPDNPKNYSNGGQVIGVTSGIKIENWYPLSNFHRMTTQRY